MPSQPKHMKSPVIHHYNDNNMLLTQNSATTTTNPQPQIEVGDATDKELQQQQEVIKEQDDQHTDEVVDAFSKITIRKLKKDARAKQVKYVEQLPTEVVRDAAVAQRFGLRPSVKGTNRYGN